MTQTKNWLSTGLLVTGLVSTALLGTIACGSDGGDDDNTGGARGTETADLSTLEAELSELQAQLEDAGADERQALLDQIEALETELSALTAPGCGFGGDCTGMAEVSLAFTPIIESMCSSIFSCCQEGEAKLALGPTVDTEEACITSLTQRLESGLEIDSFAFGSFNSRVRFELPDMATLANSIELGEVGLDADRIAECAASIDALDCSVDSPNYGCRPYASPCEIDDFVIGLVEEGGSCDRVNDFDSCAGPATCEGRNDEAECVVRDYAGDSCLSDYDCGYGQAQSLGDTPDLEYTADFYCDTRDGLCKEAGDAGDDCAFEDTSDSTLLVEPCKAGLTCSPKTLTCTDICSVGASCQGNDHCPMGSYCESDEFTVNAYRNDHYGSVYGLCEELADVGDDCESDHECASFICGDSDTCEASCRQDAALCSTTEYCDGSGSCQDKAALGEACDNDASCNDGFCVSRVCIAAAESGGSCTGTGSIASRVCPVGEYCNDSNCVALGEVDDSCSEDSECVSFFCYEESCTDRLPEGSACDATAAAAETRWYDKYELDLCVRGTYCRPATRDDNSTGVCTPQLTSGELCDRNVNGNIRQCEAELACISAPNGEKVCPLSKGYEYDENICTVSEVNFFD